MFVATGPRGASGGGMAGAAGAAAGGGHRIARWGGRGGRSGRRRAASFARAAVPRSRRAGPPRSRGRRRGSDRGRGFDLHGRRRRARRQRDLVERPLPALAVEKAQGLPAGGAGLEGEERRLRQLPDLAAVEVVVVDLEAGVGGRAAQEHDAVVVDPGRVVDGLVVRGQRRQQAAVARVDHARCGTAGRRSASRRSACRRARRAGWRRTRRAARARSRAPPPRREVQLGQIVVVAVGAREHVAAAVGRQRSARRRAGRGATTASVPASTS